LDQSPAFLMSVLSKQHEVIQWIYCTLVLIVMNKLLFHENYPN